MNTSDVLVVDGISKSFNGFLANDAISFRVQRGHVHALLGENGAGKSTLMKILYGVYRPDSGTIEIDGKPVEINSPADAQRAGIGMVFQSFMLIPAFSVLENVALSLRDQGFRLDTRAIEARIREISDAYGFDIDPYAKVWQLTIGAQQKVEIIKLLLADARLLIFDEPTSVLAPHEAEGLFRVFDSLRRRGYTIIFISHKLNEVLACCDAITVLRQGRLVGNLPRAEATEQALVSLIVGSQAFANRDYQRLPARHDTAPVAELRGVEAHDDRGRQALVDVNLTINMGEIVGVAGVSGNGQKELGEVIQGARPISAGALLIEGRDAAGRTIGQRLEAGLACIPEDPLAMGAVPPMTVEENLALGDGGGERGWLPIDWPRVRAKASSLTERFHLKMPRLNVPIDRLSGGNVQRIVVARELARRPRLLLAYYPTRGMDINAASIIRTALLAARDEGAAIVVVSEDLDELVAISDRIVVMYHGHPVGECTPDEADIHELGFLMTDGKRARHAEARSVTPG